MEKASPKAKTMMNASWMPWVVLRICARESAYQVRACELHAKSPAETYMSHDQVLAKFDVFCRSRRRLGWGGAPG